MSSTLKILTFLIFITIGVFFISNEFLGGYLSSANPKLENEINAPAQALYQWELSNQAPFKYRLLFPAIVKGSWHMLATHQQDNEAFFIMYKSWSLVFLITSVLSFFFLIKVTGFDNRWSLLGCSCFLISPPILLAYTLPVHTREDTLAYTLLSLGLICIFQNKIFLFFLISILGIFCRETLLLLPFIFLFFSNYKSFPVRMIMAAIPVGAWVALRISMESGAYDPWEGLKWNLHNMEQVIGFSYVTFSFMWFLFFYGIFNKHKLVEKNANSSITFLYRSGLAVFSLIMITTFLGGIFNEIRLLFLIFPWVIILSLHVLYKNKEYILPIIKTKKYVAYLLINVTIFGMAFVLLANNYQKFLEPSRFDIRFDIWIAVTLFYTLVTTLLIPAYLKIFSCNRPIVSKYANHL